MFASMTKYFCITFGTIYLLFLLSGVKKRWLLAIALNLLLSSFVAGLKFFLINDSGLSILGLIVFLFICACFITKQISMQIFIIFAVSFGINFTIYFFPAAIASVLIILLNLDIESLISFAVFFLPHVALVFLLFQSKRLRNSIQFLQKDSQAAGFFISVIMLSFIVQLNGAKMQMEDARTALLSAMYTAACSIFFYFWWRENIKVGYIKALQAQEKAEYTKILEQKEGEIKSLQEQNLYWHTLVHSDNKLIQALYHTVADKLHPTEENQNLMRELSAQFKQRFRENEQMKRRYARLPSTHIAMLDDVFLPYYKKKASSLGAIFDMELDCDVAHLAQTVVSASELQDLIANFLENALYAVQSCEDKMVLLRIFIDENNHYGISISDSGIDFPAHILSAMGTKPITSHSEDGGSGIGIFQAFALLQRVNASFLLETFEPPNNGYTKTISIVFDKKSTIMTKKNIFQGS